MDSNYLILSCSVFYGKLIWIINYSLLFFIYLLQLIFVVIYQAFMIFLHFSYRSIENQHVFLQFWPHDKFLRRFWILMTYFILKLFVKIEIFHFYEFRNFVGLLRNWFQKINFVWFYARQNLHGLHIFEFFWHGWYFERVSLLIISTFKSINLFWVYLRVQKIFVSWNFLFLFLKLFLFHYFFFFLLMNIFLLFFNKIWLYRSFIKISLYFFFFSKVKTRKFIRMKYRFFWRNIIIS